MNEPLTVSVAMCTFNGGAHLAEQLRSIADQTRRPDELVIYDDGSTDGTEALVQAFAGSCGIDVRWFARGERLGPAQNFERAIKTCRGDVIVLCDQDDVWHAGKVTRLLQRFAAGDAPLLVFSDLRLIDARSRLVGKTQWQALGFGGARRRLVRDGCGLDLLLRYNVVTGAGMALRSSLRDVALPIPECWMHDEWLALVASAVGGLAMVEDVLQDYRVHASQQVGPGVSGLPAQIAHAREHMDAQYFDRMARRCGVAAERLRACRDRLVRRDAPELMERRGIHYQTRRAMRAPGAKRLRPVLREWLSGRYGRFGYGWKGAAQDLLLR